MAELNLQFAVAGLFGAWHHEVAPFGGVCSSFTLPIRAFPGWQGELA